jgi:DNA polymerase-3 subunit gamma/tau
VSTALYRRYRPETFDEVIGQEHVTDPLKAAIERGRINHAYLFSGPRGCGKTTSARILARCLNCEQGPTPVPCGECPSCRDLANGGPGSLDVVEIDAASHNGVDDARDLRERAIYAPARDRYKVFILDEAHMVTSQGFNALLKIVEEPPPHIKFVFATTEPEKVIGTIRSRTHHYPFRLVPPEALNSYLDDLCNREGVQVAKGVLPLVVRAGGGSVRDTLSVLDQLIAGSGPDGVDYGRAIALLGYTPDSLLSDIVDAFSAGDGAGVFRAVERVIESGQDPRRFVEDLLERFRDLIVINAAPEAAHAFLPEVPPDRLERLTLQANGFGQGELSRAADLLNVGLTEMSGATSPRLQLELICARILLPGSGRSRDAVLSRVERMERRIGMSATGAAANLPPAQAQDPGQASTQGQAPTQGQAAAQAPESAHGQTQAPESASQASGTPQNAASRTNQPPVAAGHDDFDDIAAMAVAAESMLNSPAESAQPSESEEPAPAEQAPESAPAPESGDQQPGSSRPNEPQRTAEPQHTAQPQRDVPEQAASAPESAAAPEATSVAGSGDIGGEIEAIRRAWPSILAAVEKRSRLTRAIIAANAIPQSFSDGVVYLGFNNSGSVQGFQQRDHEAKLAAAISDVLGIQARIDIGDVGRIGGGGQARSGTHQGKGASSPPANDTGGNRGPAPSQRRPSPQEVAAVVGTREVDKPQVDHEKFWEPSGPTQGPWSSDDEEGDQPGPLSESTPEPSRLDATEEPGPEPAPAGPEPASAGPADTGDAEAGSPANLVPDLSDDDFFGPPVDQETGSGDDHGGSGPSVPPAPGLDGSSPDSGPSDAGGRPAGAPSDNRGSFDGHSPMEYVEPRWDEPTWHDGPGPGQQDAASDFDATSAGSGAVDVGAVVVPPPDDDIDSPDLGDAGSVGGAAAAPPVQTVPQVQSAQPATNHANEAKPFKSRFAALAEKHGVHTAPAGGAGFGSAPSTDAADDAGPHPASAPDADVHPQNTGSDEDEYDPETDLDVSEAPQIGVDVIARVLGGEIIDEREV